jgi:hypothetical protein
MVETAEPGAMICGLNPPSSRGPRDENGCMLSWRFPTVDEP